MSFVFEMLGLTFNTVGLFTGCYTQLVNAKRTGWYEEFFTAKGRAGDISKFEATRETVDEIITDFEEELAPEEEGGELDIAWLNAIREFMGNYWVRLTMQSISFYSSFTSLWSEMKAERYYFFFSGKSFGEIIVSSIQGFNQVIGFYDVNTRP